MENKYERVEQHYNRQEQHEGSLKPDGKVPVPPAEPVGPNIDPADEPISMGDSPPVQLEDLKTSQDRIEQ